MVRVAADMIDHRVAGRSKRWRMSEIWRTTLQVDEAGCIVIPSDVCQRLGLKAGASVILSVDADHATLLNVEAEVRRAQLLVARYIGNDVSLSEELCAERKREAARE